MCSEVDGTAVEFAANTCLPVGTNYYKCDADGPTPTPTPTPTPGPKPPVPGPDVEPAKKNDSGDDDSATTFGASVAVATIGVVASLV